MPKLKPGTIIPTQEEDAIITAAAMSDPDAIPLTDEEWEEVKPFLRIGLPPEEALADVRLDQDVLAAFKASGQGWQSRVNEALREWIKAHPVGV